MMDQYVVVSTPPRDLWSGESYSGKIIFGPASKSKCDEFVRNSQRNQDMGYSGNHLSVRKADIHVSYK